MKNRPFDHREEEEDWDAHFPDGVFAIPRDPKEPRVKIRALFAYCKEHGISPEDVPPDIMESFLVYPKEMDKSADTKIIRDDHTEE